MQRPLPNAAVPMALGAPLGVLAAEQALIPASNSFAPPAQEVISRRRPRLGCHACVQSISQGGNVTKGHQVGMDPGKQPGTRKVEQFGVAETHQP